MHWESFDEPVGDGLDVALNEARWSGIRVDAPGRRVMLVLDVLRLPVEGPAPDGPVLVVLGGVSRLAASLRNGYWNDTAAEVVPIALDELETVIHSFGWTDIYGREFIDPPERSWAHWRDRLSLDAVLGDGVAAHVIDVFQESGMAPRRHLDLRIWFDRMCVSSTTGEWIPLQEFVAAGRRWWDGLRAGDPRTDGKGIYPGPITRGSYN